MYAAAFRWLIPLLVMLPLTPPASAQGVLACPELDRIASLVRSFYEDDGFPEEYFQTLGCITVDGGSLFLVNFEPVGIAEPLKEDTPLFTVPGVSCWREGCEIRGRHDFGVLGGYHPELRGKWYFVGPIGSVEGYRRELMSEVNSCGSALDGICGEAQFGGTGECLPHTDRDDCNSCEFVGNAVCDEAALGGTGLCPPATDAWDCYPDNRGPGLSPQ